MVPTTTSITDTPALALQAELGTTCGLVCPWLGLLGGGVIVGSGVGAGNSGAIGAVRFTRSITLLQ
jgi:hypothetical protein